MLSQAVFCASVWKEAPHEEKKLVFEVPQFPYLKQNPWATCDHHDVPPEALYAL